MNLEPVTTLESKMRASRWHRAPVIRATLRPSFHWTIEYRGNGASHGGVAQARVVPRPRYADEGAVSSRLTRAMRHRSS
jgi:hypothetical protein